MTAIYNAFTMLFKLRAMRKDAVAFREGYDYAAGDMLLNGTCSVDLRSKAFSESRHPYNKGMIAAILDFNEYESYYCSSVCGSPIRDR